MNGNAGDIKKKKLHFRFGELFFRAGVIFNFLASCLNGSVQPLFYFTTNNLGVNVYF